MIQSTIYIRTGTAWHIREPDGPGTPQALSRQIKRTRAITVWNEALAIDYCQFRAQIAQLCVRHHQRIGLPIAIAPAALKNLLHAEEKTLIFPTDDDDIFAPPICDVSISERTGGVAGAGLQWNRWLLTDAGLHPHRPRTPATNTYCLVSGPGLEAALQYHWLSAPHIAGRVEHRLSLTNKLPASGGVLCELCRRHAPEDELRAAIDRTRRLSIDDAAPAWVRSFVADLLDLYRAL